MRIGLDLVSVRRLAAALERSAGFAARTFTSAELALCEGMPPRRRAEFLAGRLAVKEAVLKAVGAGGAERDALLEIETLADDAGAPHVALCGGVARRAAEVGGSSLAVSITHETGTAAAVVVLH